jgi:hypothetical protein
MFLVYSLAKSDFVLLRKNVSLHELFDGIIISMAVGLFLARVFYIIELQEFSWFHPFRFVHLARLPGLSIFGFFIGVLPVLYLFLKRKKVLLRVYDIVFISFLPLFMFSLITRTYSLVIPGYIVQVLLAFAGLLVLWICTKFYHNYTLKDGGIAMIILMFFSIDLLIYGFVAKYSPLVSILSFSQLSAVILFFGALTVFVLNQLGNFSKKR